MANIYLRVPTVLAQFYRHRNVKQHLSEFEAVKFSPFQPEYLQMSGCLEINTISDLTSTACFSQREFRNILQGRPPKGGQRMLTRDAEEWPTMREVCLLTGEKKIQRTDGYDYLCIEMPREILVGTEYRATNASYALMPPAANKMVGMMRNFFVFVLLDWIRKERRFCNEVGIERDLAMMVDHFFYHYDICIGTNGKDRESMRRMAVRWVEDAQLLPNDGVDFFADEELRFIYENEREQQDIPVEELIRQLRAEIAQRAKEGRPTLPRKKSKT